MSDTIYTLMGRVLAELPAIGKNQENTQQHFKFRGIDDVMNALNPLLAAHGVFFLPHVLERVDSERATSGGKAMYVVNLHVQYTFYGPDGDSVTASGWGEGTDMGDKATNKAMTGAMKYVLFQAFAISTEEASENDADRTVPEATSGGRPAQNAPLADQTVPAGVAEKLTARINALPAEQRTACKKEFAEQFGKPAELRRGQHESAEALVAGYEVTAAVPPERKEGDQDSIREPTSIDAATGGDAGQQAPPGPPPSARLRGMVHASMAEAGITDDMRHDWAANILGRPVTSYGLLSSDDYRKLADHLQSTAVAS